MGTRRCDTAMALVYRCDVYVMLWQGSPGSTCRAARRRTPKEEANKNGKAAEYAEAKVRWLLPSSSRMYADASMVGPGRAYRDVWAPARPHKHATGDVHARAPAALCLRGFAFTCVSERRVHLIGLQCSHTVACTCCGSNDMHGRAPPQLCRGRKRTRTREPRCVTFAAGSAAAAWLTPNVHYGFC
jgi:hypothetical protein